MITQIILIYKSNGCYDWALKVAQKGLKKRGFIFSYDGTSEWEKKSFVNKNNEKCTSEFKIYVTVLHGSRVAVSHHIFKIYIIFLTIL